MNFALWGLFDTAGPPADDFCECHLTALAWSLRVNHLTVVDPDAALCSIGAGEGQLRGGSAKALQLDDVEGGQLVQGRRKAGLAPVISQLFGLDQGFEEAFLVRRARHRAILRGQPARFARKHVRQLQDLIPLKGLAQDNEIFDVSQIFRDRFPRMFRVSGANDDVLLRTFFPDGADGLEPAPPWGHVHVDKDNDVRLCFRQRPAHHLESFFARECRIDLELTLQGRRNRLLKERAVKFLKRLLLRSKGRQNLQKGFVNSRIVINDENPIDQASFLFTHIGCAPPLIPHYRPKLQLVKTFFCYPASLFGPRCFLPLPQLPTFSGVIGSGSEMMSWESTE
ncbi:MAG TPA: hypothetical protein VNU68_22960 [Verrucomicrobiae bacterium]|nr:hypothetical protein [Verrucomicrobiae bacterium]